MNVNILWYKARTAQDQTVHSENKIGDIGSTGVRNKKQISLIKMDTRKCSQKLKHASDHITKCQLIYKLGLAP